ncbi:MAG: hypothetical protein ACHQM6_02755, partial [Candidatus Kapaibacterium sp.]
MPNLFVGIISIYFVLSSGCKSHSTSPNNSTDTFPSIQSFIDIPIGSNDIPITRMALSPDGSRLAVYSGITAHWKIFDVKKGQLLCSSNEAFDSPSMHFSLDNIKILLSNISFVSTYDISGSSPRLLSTITNPTAMVSPTLYDDGSKIIIKETVPFSNPLGNIFNTNGGSLLKTIHPNFPYPGGGFGFIQDENAIVYGDGSTARVWSVEHDSELRHFELTPHGDYNIETSEDGLTAVAGLFDTTTSIIGYYNTKTGQKIIEFNIDGSNASYSSSCFSKN